MLQRFQRPFVLLAVIALYACSHNKTTTLTFGSCLRQWEPQPVWQGVMSLHPEVFVFLGDNVYSDIDRYKKYPEPFNIQQAYHDLNLSTDYQHFIASAKRNKTSIFAVWDDHDYGKNDAGAGYPFKLDSKNYFLDFFDIDVMETGLDHAGIYHSKILNLNELTIQFLLLDTRSFRSPLKHDSPSESCPKINLVPNHDKTATILGDAQWQWLEAELSKPADIRILASSIQLLPTQHCYEKWANFPKERERLFELLRSTQANGLIVVSGDRHLAEISILPRHVVGFPLYEVTSSGLNSAMGEQSQGKSELNQLRATQENVLVNNFGSIEIEKHEQKIELKLQIRDESGLVSQQKKVLLDALNHESRQWMATSAVEATKKR